MSENKKPWAMPTPPPDIKKIISKLDSNQNLTQSEHKALGDWEDSKVALVELWGVCPWPSRRAHDRD